MRMTQEERKETVLYAPADQAAALVFMWVKSGVITLKEFKEMYRYIDWRPEAK